MLDDVSYCRQKIDECHAKARVMDSPEAAEIYLQLANLYEIRLRFLDRSGEPDRESAKVPTDGDQDAESQPRSGFGDILACIA